MKKHISNIVIWLVLVAWFIVVSGFVVRSNESQLCKALMIHVSDSLEHRFITSLEVRRMLEESGEELQGYSVDAINTRRLEEILEKNPYVSNAEVFTNVEGNLFAKVNQRKPLMRVMPGKSHGFYIDHDLTILPLSDRYTPNVLLINGNIDFEILETEDGNRAVDTTNDPELEALMKFSNHVASHPFWSKQIVQIYRAGNGDFELIPRVGAHQIIFGTMADFEIKLNRLKLLYDQGFNKYGWNRYDKINLKYSNQIICTKR